MRLSCLISLALLGKDLNAAFPAVRFLVSRLPSEMREFFRRRNAAGVGIGENVNASRNLGHLRVFGAPPNIQAIFNVCVLSYVKVIHVRPALETKPTNDM